jgi:hypothetical protein
MMKAPFACVSKAYHSKNDGREPLDGVRNLARVAHASRVPVTWIITEQAAVILARELEQWHVEFGDEVAAGLVRLPVDTEAYAERREAIRKACPWSEVTVAGIGGGKSGKMLTALEAAGFEGLWGYCWEQVYEDGISDYGQPPGLFAASPHSYKMPSPDGRGITAIEWLSRDLNKAFWTANPINYAAEPDALLLFGDWGRETSLKYMQHLLAEYARNAAAGHPIPFIFQEEAAQLMHGMIDANYDRLWSDLLAFAQDCFSMLDQQTFQVTTLPALVKEFRATPRSAQLLRAGDQRYPSLRRPDRGNFGIWGAEWVFPEVAHYSDARRYCTFAVGNPAPVRLIRYDRQQEISVAEALIPETNLPRLIELHRSERGCRARIRSASAMPYALALEMTSPGPAPEGCAVNGDLAVWPVEVLAGEHWYEMGGHHAE